MIKRCPICKEPIHALDDIVQNDNGTCYHTKCVALVPVHWIIIKKPTLDTDPEPLGETSDDGMSAFELLSDGEFADD